MGLPAAQRSLTADPAQSAALAAPGASGPGINRVSVSLFQMDPMMVSSWITPPCTASGARDAGRLRLEGKEYLVQEGDVMHFRFNV